MHTIIAFFFPFPILPHPLGKQGLLCISAMSLRISLQLKNAYEKALTALLPAVRKVWLNDCSACPASISQKVFPRNASWAGTKKKKKSIKHIIPVHSRVLYLLKYFAYFDTSIIYKKWLSIISTLHNSYSYLVLQNDLPLRLF